MFPLIGVYFSVQRSDVPQHQGDPKAQEPGDAARLLIEKALMPGKEHAMVDDTQVITTSYPWFYFSVCACMYT
jgi:hypothetical protein